MGYHFPGTRPPTEIKAQHLVRAFGRRPPPPEADKQAGNQCHVDLQLHAILTVTEEMSTAQDTFKPAEEQLSGEGLARCLDWYPARFQPLPIGTAREVFPQAARPVGFTTRVMGQGDTGSDFHWYAAAPWSGLSFQSQNNPRTP